MSTERLAPALLTVASATLLATLLWGGAGSGPLFVTLVAAFPGLLALLVARGGRMTGVLIALTAVQVAAGWGVLLLTGRPRDWLGLPPAATVMLVGLWLLPLAIAVGGYTWTFDGWSRAAEERREPGSGPP